MIFWLCSGMAIGSALLATFVGDIRKAIMSLWLTGLGVGGLYLLMGAELLAIVQWVVSTLVAMGFLFYAVMFGEYGLGDSRPPLKRAAAAFFPTLLGAGFVAVLWYGASELKGFTDIQPEAFRTSGMTAQNLGETNLTLLGRVLADEHLLSLEILALTLFLVVLGSGVVARPEEKQK